MRTWIPIVCGWAALSGSAVAASFVIPSSVSLVAFHTKPLQNKHNYASTASCLFAESNDSSRNSADSTPSKRRMDRVAIAGAGPSGLLLAHGLLRAKLASKVVIYEQKSDPRLVASAGTHDAYALGVGIRGRTAIQRVDESLWQTILQHYQNDRKEDTTPTNDGDLIRICITPKVQIPLPTNTPTADDPNKSSLLLFQTDLCVELLHQLQQRYDSSQLNIHFDTPILQCDLTQQRLHLTVQKRKNGQQDELVEEDFDWIAGCDGRNSKIREAMINAAKLNGNNNPYHCEHTVLSKQFKVVRLDSIPPLLDPTAVSILLTPPALTSAVPARTWDAATTDPHQTVDTACSIVFLGTNKNDFLQSNNRTEILQQLSKNKFLQGVDLNQVADQILSQGGPAEVSTVTCDLYHYQDKAVLLGDAAHATSGAAGQGLNSALMDAAVLVECLEQTIAPQALSHALLQYSRMQVPEGKALYELSDGEKASGWRGVKTQFRDLRDFLFQGRWGVGRLPLHPLLTTSLKSFAEVRRDRDTAFATAFPSAEEFDRQITELHRKAFPDK